MDPRRLAIDPNNPTREEVEAHNRKVAAHNMKVSKANLASNLLEKMCSNQGLAQYVVTDPGVLSKAAVGMAEFVLETYSLMEDGAGNKGGLVS